MFNSQSLVQVGGRWNEVKQTLEHPFQVGPAQALNKLTLFLQGVLTGISYNGLRPLDLALDKSDRIRVRGGVKALKSIPFNYKALNPDLFVDSVIKSTELYIHDGSGMLTACLPARSRSTQL